MNHPITGHTGLICLLGSPCSHSISPMMHNTAFESLGLDYRYLAFDVDEAGLETAVEGLKTLGARGFNLTMPNKNKMLSLCDRLSPAAEIIGAVNTVVNDNGILTGHNTDGIGYMRSLQDTGYNVKSGAMTLFGAGGAASSIAIQAALDGVPALHIINRRGRSWENAKRLVKQITENTDCHADLTDMADHDAVRNRIANSTLLANATSIGRAPDTNITPVPDLSCFHTELLVSDIIYNPRCTRLLQDAMAAGCKTFNGMYMLLYQGAAAFRIWTGQDMPVEEIRRKFFS